MSRDTQAKVKAMLGKVAASHNLELVDDRRFSNTGVWRFQYEDSLDDVMTIKYDFQNDYCGMRVVGVDPEFGPGIIGGGYITPKTLPGAVERITNCLAQRQKDE